MLSSVAMCFAKRNAYLCSHAKLYDFINFASFLMLLTRIFGTADIDSCVTRDFVLRLFKFNFLLTDTMLFLILNFHSIVIEFSDEQRSSV